MLRNGERNVTLWVNYYFMRTNRSQVQVLLHSFIADRDFTDLLPYLHQVVTNTDYWAE